ncbi:MAG TPA: NAD(P)/FAD-dependent oxidoreductase [Terrimicrobiaceae bacterium]|nr:NAD(P)/FAD-dependent oxidoreductase [Terrimicrobiaceae bacterium]
MADALYDVAIIGGGPAGSIAAASLSRAGRKVAVFEREKFPRFHIGESLLPFSMEAFARLGLMPKLEAAGFVCKHGAEITSGCGSGEIRFYFKDGFRSKRSTALQVERSKFDKILLDHARECGAHVREEVTVEDIALQRSRPRLRIHGPAQAVEDIEAEYLLDCSGRHSVIGTRLGLKRDYPGLQKFALYAHYEGAKQPGGIDGTLTRMVRARDHWFWIIPLSREKISVGVVIDTSRYRSFGGSPAAVLDRFLEEQPIVRERLAGARRVTKVYASGDYSYRNAALCGERWLMAGDAAGFIDPIFSSGVFLAVLSGDRAADALDKALSEPHRASKHFALYERRLAKVMSLYLRFVYSWYRQEFVETVLAPREFFQVVPAVNAVLAGNVGRSFALRWRIWLFHLIVAIQRVIPISPRLPLAPKPS